MENKDERDLSSLNEEDSKEESFIAEVKAEDEKQPKRVVDKKWLWIVLAIGVLAPLVVYTLIMGRMPDGREDLERHPSGDGVDVLMPSALPTQSVDTVAPEVSAEPTDDPNSGEVTVRAPTLDAINFKHPSYSEGVTGWEVTLGTLEPDMFKVYHELEGADTKEDFAPEYDEYADEVKEALKSEGTFVTFEDFNNADGYLAFQGSNAESTQRFLLYCQVSGSQQVTVSYYFSGDVAEYDEASRLIREFLGARVDAGTLEKMQFQAEGSVKHGGTYSVLLMDAELGIDIQVAVQNYDEEMETWVISASRVLKGPIAVDNK